MKRFKQKWAGLTMALGMFAAMTCAGEVVSGAAGGWFAVDAREVKGTTLEGGAIVAGETNLVLQCSPSAWGAADGGSGATIAYGNVMAGNVGTIAENTTAESVDWTPSGAGIFVLTNSVATSGEPVVMSSTFAVSAQAGDDAWAYVNDGTCAISGVSARQRYPWNGKVDIAYTTANLLATAIAKGINVEPKVVAIDKSTAPWTTNVAEAACLFVGPRAVEPLTTVAALSNGAHRIVWDMNAQGLFYKSDKVVFAISAEGKEL